MSNCTIIVFGATGDLARRKLLPALAHCIERGVFERVAWVGTARQQITLTELITSCKQLNPEIDQAVWQCLYDVGSYISLDFTQAQGYEQLVEHVVNQERIHGLSGNRMIYLATNAQLFCDITQQIHACGLAQRVNTDGAPWYRLAYEKPFGHDGASARTINACIRRYFFEHQIYRVDHYLTKELVSNIALVRFTNSVLEPLWNHTYVDNVQIILDEQLGLEGRGSYYDAYGALADVVQNHMLQLLALIAMEAPKRLTGDFIRAQRAQVLERTRVTDGILGQMSDYHEQKGVAAASRTETFAALALAVDTPRWRGVPFYLRTGKCLPAKQTVIHVVFKAPVCLLTEHCPVAQNRLTIRITPDATFSLSLNIKKPGTSEQVQPIRMEFCHSCVFGKHIPDAYEILLEEMARAEQSTSVRFDEIEYAWSIIDQARTLAMPLEQYKCGTRGPSRLLAQFARMHDCSWCS